jgi:hypothetical protein
MCIINRVLEQGLASALCDRAVGFASHKTNNKITQIHLTDDGGTR